MKRFFVTGTDTGVGKTFVTAAIARRARELGKRVFAFKPIETGCEQASGLVGGDQEILCAAAGEWQEGTLRGVYQLARPLAPLLAAQADSVEIDLARIEAVVRKGSDNVNLVLVEGAGGWRVPITRDEDMSVLARRLEAPLIVVARAGLGTINHTLLTVEAIERDGCTIAAVVLSMRPEDDLELALSNHEQIRRLSSLPVVVFAGDASTLDLFV